MKRKKGVSLLASMALLMALVAACGTNGGGSDVNSGNQSSEPQAESNDNSGSDSKVNSPVTITTVFGASRAPKFVDGETIEDNVHTRWAKEALGIETKTLWSVTGRENYENKLQLMLAGGEQVPDVFFMYGAGSNLQQNLIEAGLLKDISEDWDKYASPRLKEAYAKYPEMWTPFTKNGKIYGLPMPGTGDPNALMWIRQDWLDKLGMKAPVTIEEFEQVMDAFTNKDPDGNGKNDTIGMSLSSPIATWLTTGDAILGALGDGKSMLGQWTKDGNGGLQYGSVTDSTKQALAKLSDWFKKGYLDKEFALLDEQKAAESFLKGRSGIMFGHAYLPGYLFKDMPANVPGSQVKAYPVPVGKEGKPVLLAGGMISNHIAFGKDFKHMDVFLRYFDMLTGPFDENSPFKYGNHEGYDYKLVDGKPVYDGLPEGVDVKVYFLHRNQYELPGTSHVADYEAVAAGKTDNAFQIKFAGGRSQEEKDAYVTFYKQKEEAILIRNLFEGAPTETLKSKGDLLKKMEKENIIKFIMGARPIEEFDGFVNEWKEAGGDKVTMEVSDWYRAATSKS